MSEHISLTLDLRELFLSLQIIRSLANTADAWAILGRTPDLQPSSDTTVPKYLELITTLNFWPFMSMSHFMTSLFICH